MTALKPCFLWAVLLLLNQTAYCDTLNYWYVYQNEVLVRQFNETSKDLSLHLDVKDIQKNDTLSFRYFPCSLCIDCTYHIEVRPSKSKQTLILASAKESEALAFNLYNFVRLTQFLFHTEFQFYLYYSAGASGTSRHQTLLVLNLK